MAVLHIHFMTSLCVAIILVLVESSVDDNASGHLKPFGSSGPFLPVAEVDGFPKTSQFFEQHVLPGIPLKMIGAGQLSRAFEVWSDEYFLSSEVNIDSVILVETVKKENRTKASMNLHFHEFVRSYQSEDQYMVDRVPDEFQQDVLLPGPLQCSFVYEEMLVDAVMWMSDGGTSSVVHTDSVDNIICIYDGRKKFVMIDPGKYGTQITVDHPEGGYFGMDVDRVDYSKYPGLVGVEYYVVDLVAGDCLYIPFKWIHQVRSYDRNLAVNVWWSHNMNQDVDVKQCSDSLDLGLTLNKVTFHGFESLDDDADILREHLLDILGNGVESDEFFRRFIGDTDAFILLDQDSGYKLPLMQMFLIIDKNRDKVATGEEIEQLSERDWDMIMKQTARFESILDDAAEKRSLLDRKREMKDEL